MVPVISGVTRVQLARGGDITVRVSSTRRVTQSHAQTRECEHLAEVLELPVQARRLTALQGGLATVGLRLDTAGYWQWKQGQDVL